ncbi:MAG: ABC transporter permease, partial [Elusimicrobiaceae bacterium]|nr:ABC transporter permease [Elusimicrobiaceae bacterium]
MYRGTVWQFFLNGIALAACALSVATLISTIANTQQQAMMGGVLILLPAILLSGVFFPVANIPEGFRWL